MDRRVVITLAVAFVAIAAAAALVCFVPYSHSDDSVTADESECLNFTFPEGGGQIWITNKGGNSPDCKYSTDGKATWTDFESDKKVDVAGGGKVYVKGDNPRGFSSTNMYTKFGMDVKSIGETVSASGSVMSLIDGDRAPTLTIPNEYCFDSLFYECGVLSSAPVLPATTLANCCYYGMFARCTSLTVAPSLPATTLVSGCYYSMFKGCTSLTVAPALPATVLAESCYALMFSRCTSLTVAPALPATTLVSGCYYAMFEGCTSLNTILCYVKDISAANCTAEWLSGVSFTGNFYSRYYGWQKGASGIPSGWTWHEAFIAVIFDPMGGITTKDGKPTNSYSIAESSRTIDLPSAERIGWIFDGWYTEPEGGTKIEPDKVYKWDTTIYAHWKRYTLTFDPNGGSGGPSPVKGEGYRTLPTTVPTYTDNTFVGWKEKDKETIYGPGDQFNLTADVTLYAVWGGTVSFNPTVGTGGGTFVIKNGDKTTFPAAPVHPTLTFQGWSCDGTTIYNPGDNYTVSGDATFYAMWGNPEPSSDCIISFDLRGGSDADGSFNVAKVSKGASFTIPSDTPSKTGCTFAGWKCGDKTYQKGATIPNITEDMEFEAQWTPNQYTITFDTDGGSSINPIKQNYGTAVAKPANPTKQGYVFVAWDRPVPDTMPAEDITINAIWKVETGAEYVIIFEMEGGSGSFGTMRAAEGADVTLPGDEPVRTGYKFGGWSCNGVTYKSGSKIERVSSDMTLKAVWTPVRYTVVFHGEGVTDTQEMTYDVAAALKPNAFEKDGFDFRGWSSIEGSKTIAFEDEQEVRNLPFDDNKECHLYAVWGPKMDAGSGEVEKGSDLSVSVDSDAASGGIGAVTFTDGYGNESKVPKEQYEVSAMNGGITNITVLGSYTNTLSPGGYSLGIHIRNGGVSEGTVKIISPRPDPPTPPEPVPTPTYYEVSYDIAGGSEPGPGTVLYKEGDTAEVASYNGHKDGYYFDGWSCNGKTYKTGDEFVVSGNMKFTAIWVPNSNPAPESSEDNTVMVVGVVGVIAAVALIGGAAYFIRRR